MLALHNFTYIRNLWHDHLKFSFEVIKENNHHPFNLLCKILVDMV